MIDIEELFERISNHVAACKSASFVCNRLAAFESWFRVELNPVLWELGYSPAAIDTNYTYPNSKDKADLCIRDNQNNIIVVFELKPFVKGQDSNKKDKYPAQIQRLENLIFARIILQAITLTTFIGYTELQMNSYMDEFFKSSWSKVGPKKLIEQYKLYAAIASIKSI